MTPRPTAPVHKIVITGTGRAGTTFLVQLLTKLGLDTGYTSETLQRDYFNHCSAGLEHDLEHPEAPLIVKSPLLCESLPGIMERRTIVIDHAIIPMRALDDAANSRIRVGGEGETPGGLWGTGQAEQQKAVLAEKFHQLIHTLTVHDIPHTFLNFPQFARDADYTFRKLSWLFPHVSREDFIATFRSTARPDLIHNFGSRPPENRGEAARVYAAEKKRLRWHRRARRAVAAGILSVLAWTGLGWMPGGEEGDDNPDAVEFVASGSPKSPVPLWLLQHASWRFGRRHWLARRPPPEDTRRPLGPE